MLNRDNPPSARIMAARWWCVMVIAADGATQVSVCESTGSGWQPRLVACHCMNQEKRNREVYKREEHIPTKDTRVFSGIAALFVNFLYT